MRSVGILFNINLICIKVRVQLPNVFSLNSYLLSGFIISKPNKAIVFEGFAEGGPKVRYQTANFSKLIQKCSNLTVLYQFVRISEMLLQVTCFFSTPQNNTVFCFKFFNSFAEFVDNFLVINCITYKGLRGRILTRSQNNKYSNIFFYP